MCVITLIAITSQAFGQTAYLHGQVFDESGAVISKATVTITAASGLRKITSTGADGSYSLSSLPPGDYTVQATAPKLEQKPVQITLKAGSQTLRLELKVALTTQQFTVQESAGPTLGTESSSNVSALVLKGEGLKALADDPEDLMTDLQALAGPSAGPSGGSIFIDGFSTGQLPSKKRHPGNPDQSEPVLSRVRQAGLRPHRNPDQTGCG